MIWLYRILFPIAALISAPHYLRRMLKRGGYGKNIGMRLGLWPNLPSKKLGIQRIWIQAVSVGEVVSISPLLKALAVEENIEVVLSCTTSTGLHLAQTQHRENIIALGPFPIDWLPFS
ncbi:MAG: 3-deoxy-D-manno-octulosonic acid transferase, partial [Opitutae bacterium]|nr:3-deoxy-D-manno-octulosonic acid transferase [Opitutae bacterium]